MLEQEIEIINKAGLHARAASKLVALATRFSSDIKLGQTRMVDGKSILSLMMLGATKGTTLRLQVDGDDEAAAMAAIVQLINNRFDEDR